MHDSPPLKINLEQMHRISLQHSLETVFQNSGKTKGHNSVLI